MVMQKDGANKLVCAVQLTELRAEQNKLNQEKVDLENQLEAEQVCQTASLMGQTELLSSILLQTPGTACSLGTCPASDSLLDVR